MELSFNHHNQFFYKIQMQAQILDTYVYEYIQTLEFGLSSRPTGTEQQV